MNETKKKIFFSRMDDNVISSVIYYLTKKIRLMQYNLVRYYVNYLSTSLPTYEVKKLQTNYLKIRRLIF